MVSPMAKKALIAVFGLSLQLGCATDTKNFNNTWHQLNGNDQIGGLAMPHCYVSGQVLFIHGGIRDQANFSPFNSHSAILNLQSNTWHKVSELSAPEPKTMQAIAGNKEQVLIFGGSSQEVQFTSNAYLYDSHKDSWISFDNTGIEPRIRHSVVTINEKAVIYGGEGAKVNLNWGYYDFQNKQWQAFDLPAGHPSRIHFVAEELDGELLIWGGFEDRKKSSSGFLLNLHTQVLTPLPQANSPSPRSNAKSLSFGDKVMIWGGSPVDENANSGAIFDKASFSWQVMPAIPDNRYRDLKNPSVTKLKDHYAIIWGGRFGNEAFNNEAWAFDLKEWRWSKLQQSNTPPGRMMHCMVAVADDELLLFGGIGTDEEGFLHFKEPFRIKIQSLGKKIAADI